MAQTQKMYLGTHEIGIQYLGDDQIIQRGAFEYVLDIDYLVVAGGGGGGDGFDSGNNAGGGGAGRFVSSSYSLGDGDTLSAVIGGGGAVDSDGNDSSLIGSGLTIRMNGGGFGGRDDVNSGDGNDGGSGGGGCVIFGGGSSQGGTATNASLTSDLAGIGNNGSNGGSLNGGAGGGVSTQWFDGITYCVGGTADGVVRTTPGSGGRGGSAISDNATAGLDGIVKIRYLGNQQATGGTISSSGGYTYHTFTSNGTFTVTG